MRVSADDYDPACYRTQDPKMKRIYAYKMPSLLG